MNADDNSRKRKADALGRLNAGQSDEKKGTIKTVLRGRGSIDGYVSCPLCEKFSKKKYARGRGLSNHIIQIHTPWKPTKMSLKIARRREEERQRQCNNGRQQKKQKVVLDEESKLVERIPSRQEIEAWDEKVLEIIASVENDSRGENDIDNGASGVDRSGNQVSSYRQSLPLFLKAAADGDLDKLQKMVAEEEKKDINALLETKDRHSSQAEHWAAGGGHLECLKFLLDKRSQHCCSNNDSKASQKLKLRRRDGKTCLHYAARNGHLNCIKYLLQDAKFDVNEQSGEGTTPFHMACYGGHPEVAMYLAKHGANVHATNEWKCDAAQFLGMTISSSQSEVRKLCNFLKDEGISLIRRQNQGHTILHKAAQKLNHHVIQWLANPSEKDGAGLSKEEFDLIGAPDLGGHKASQIWRKFGGDEKVADWMESLSW